MVKLQKTNNKHFVTLTHFKNVNLTFASQLFGVAEDEAVQEADEGEVLQRVPRVLDGAPLRTRPHVSTESTPDWRRASHVTRQPFSHLQDGFSKQRHRRVVVGGQLGIINININITTTFKMSTLLI